MNIKKFIQYLEKNAGEFVGDDFRLEAISHVIGGFWIGLVCMKQADRIDYAFSYQFHNWVKHALEEQEKTQLDTNRNYIYYICCICQEEEQKLALFFKLCRKFFGDVKEEREIKPFAGEDMNAEKLIKRLEMRPQMYVGDDLNLQSFSYYIGGFIYSKLVLDIVDEVDLVFNNQFNGWVKSRLEEQEDIQLEENRNYVYYICRARENEEQRMALFFDLCRKFFG